MNADRTYYVLDRLLSHVLETKAELIAYLIVHDAGNHDPAGVGQRLQARRHIDAVSENVIAVENDVADIDADAEFDAEFDALVRRCRGVALCHAALDIDRATDGIDHAHELHEHSIARRFDGSAAMFGDLGIDEFLTVPLELAPRAFLIGARPSTGCSRQCRRRKSPPACGPLDLPAFIHSPETPI